MDLSKLNTQKAANQSADVVLVNPFNGEVLKDSKGGKVVINVMGFQSEAARNKIASQKRVKHADQEKQGAELLATLTTGWTDNIELDGKKLDYSFDNAVMLYEREDWVARQVLDVATNIANYEPKK
jgi:hypothetical protein